MTQQRFRYWVVLAGMRTGSNLLEEHLASFPGLSSYGELFNPHFFGRPKIDTQFGLSMTAREADPVRVIDAMCANAPDMPGFRLFYDHDPRVIAHVLGDPSAAKIVLTRQPVDSYVSLKVARKTGQWWLGDVTAARTAKVRFDAEEFADFLRTLSDFQGMIRHRLQATGQTAFHIDYDDLSRDEVIDGLGLFLGAEGQRDSTRIRAKVQNPGALADRLSNPEAAKDALAQLSAPDISQAPLREPGRGPGLRFFHAAQDLPLLYMPIRGAGGDPIPDWLARADADRAPVSGLTQQDIRRWKRQHPGHRSFTVVRHPLPRAYDAFCRYILPTGHDAYADLRAALRERYDVPLPPGDPDESWTLEAHREAFLGFLHFLKANLGGQTSLRVDNTWASQAILLQAIADFALPDRVIRDDNLQAALGEMVSEVHGTQAPQVGAFDFDAPYPLSQVRSDDVDTAIRAAYQRDFMMFGYRAWQG